MRRFLIAFLLLALTSQSFSQEDENRIISSVVLDSMVVFAGELTEEDFINQILSDSNFYNSFADLKFYNYVGKYDLRTYDKRSKLEGKSALIVNHEITNGIQKTQTVSQVDSGNLYKKNGEYELFTIRMFSYLFPFKGQINLAKAENEADSGGIEANFREKLKKLICYPGQPIDGIPFLGDKTAIFDDKMRPFYTYEFFHATYQDTIPVYRFRCKLKDEFKNGKESLLIDELTSLFEKSTFNVIARYIEMSYDKPIAKCDVKMSFELQYVGENLVAKEIEYDGFWDVPLKKKEKAYFKVTHSNLSDSDFVK
jgi:hypothetical protein